MQLGSYLDDNKISDSDFAERIGVERQTVHRYRSGKRFPERAVLLKIIEATNGSVTANDFVDVETSLVAPDAPASEPERTS